MKKSNNKQRYFKLVILLVIIITAIVMTLKLNKTTAFIKAPYIYYESSDYSKQTKYVVNDLKSNQKNEYKVSGFGDIIESTYNEKDNSILLFSRVHETILKINKDGSNQILDFKKNLKNYDNAYLLSNFQSNKNNYFIYVNSGFKALGYQNCILVLNKKYEVVKKIEVNTLIKDYAVKNDNLYYIQGGLGEKYEDTKRVVKYNLNNDQQTTIYQNKDNKITITSLFFYNDKLYYIIIDQNGYHIVDEKFKVLKTNTNYKKGLELFTKQTMNDNKTNYLSVFYNSDDEGLLTIKNNQVIITKTSDICNVNTSFVTNNNLYCQNKKKQIIQYNNKKKVIKKDSNDLEYSKGYAFFN